MARYVSWREILWWYVAERRSKSRVAKVVIAMTWPLGANHDCRFGVARFIIETRVWRRDSHFHLQTTQWPPLRTSAVPQRLTPSDAVSISEFDTGVFFLCFEGEYFPDICCRLYSNVAHHLRDCRKCADPKAANSFVMLRSNTAAIPLPPTSARCPYGIQH